MIHDSTWHTLKTTDEVGCLNTFMNSLNDFCAKSNWRVSWLKSHRTRKLTHKSKSSATHLTPSQSVIVIEVTQRTTTTRLTSWLGKHKNLGSMLWVSECGPSRTLRITFALQLKLKTHNSEQLHCYNNTLETNECDPRKYLWVTLASHQIKNSL